MTRAHETSRSVARRRGWRSQASGLAAAAGAAARERLRYKGDVLGTGLFLAFVLFVFARLWSVVLSDGEARAGGFTIAQLVAYLLVTELVTMSPGPVHDRIAEDVRSGAFTVHLLRPLSYARWELARGVGSALTRAATLLVLGTPVVVVLVGWPAVRWEGLAFGFGVLLPGAILLAVTIRMLIGFLAFWMEDPSPIYWIESKMAFVLGGMFLPLELYPGWLQAIASWLPFQAVLHGPARTIVSWDPGFAGAAALRLGLWVALGLVALHAADAAGRRRVQANGG